MKDFGLDVEKTQHPRSVSPVPCRLPYKKTLKQHTTKVSRKECGNPQHFLTTARLLYQSERKIRKGNQRENCVSVATTQSLTIPSLPNTDIRSRYRKNCMRKFGGGYLYSKIDLSDAHYQIHLSSASQVKLAVSTHRGVLLQQRLPFGIASAPGYFQEIMDRLTQDLPGVATHMDDILVNGADAESNLSNLSGLLQRLDTKGLRCRKEKCVFAQESIEYPFLKWTFRKDQR